MSDQILTKLIESITVGHVVKTTTASVYKIYKHFHFNDDQLEQLCDDVCDLLQQAKVDAIIVDKGTHHAPHTPFKGYAHIETASHYWILIQVVDPY